MKALWSIVAALTDCDEVLDLEGEVSSSASESEDDSLLATSSELLLVATA